MFWGIFEFKSKRMRVVKLRFIICVCVWLMFLCGSCYSSLKVSSPENLKGTYACAVSNLGVPQHGGTLTGVVVYPKVNQKACNHFSFKTKIHAGSLPVFLLADTGDCYFAWKARNAENAGAAGILIANDHELLSSMHFPQVVDGYNMENLTIPSALISRSLGDSIKKALYEGEFVRVNLEWPTEGFTHHQNEQADTNKIEEITECQSDYCNDQIQDHESDVRRRFLIKSTPAFLGFLMMNMKSWLLFLWENGIIMNM